MIRWVITKHKHNDYKYLTVLSDFCVKQLRDIEINIAYLDSSLTPLMDFFNYSKTVVTNEGLNFKRKWDRGFTIDNCSRLCCGTYRVHSILRGISNNIVILNDFNCCPERTQLEIANCYFPMWASNLCTTVIVTVDESKPNGKIIDDLIKQYGCSHT